MEMSGPDDFSDEASAGGQEGKGTKSNTLHYVSTQVCETPIVSLKLYFHRCRKERTNESPTLSL